MALHDTIRTLARAVRMRDFAAADLAIDDIAATDWAELWTDDDVLEETARLPEAISAGRADATARWERTRRCRRSPSPTKANSPGLPPATRRRRRILCSRRKTSG
jgi:hypothetical protein